MSPAFRDVLIAQAKYLINRSDSVRKFGHHGLEGDLREVFIQDFLKPLLPNNLGIGRGKIVSSYNQISRQVDCLIYDKNIMAPAFASERSGIFPIESTLMTIEVKTKLTAEELRDSHSAAKELSKFMYAPPVGVNSFGPDHKIEHLISCVFAYDSDLKVESEIDRYNRIRGTDDSSIRVICVIGRGIWICHNDKWTNWDFGFEHGEIIGLIVNISNTCERIASSRRRPDFRSYTGWETNT